MLIRTSLIAAALFLSSCGSDSSSTQTLAAASPNEENPTQPAAVEPDVPLLNDDVETVSGLLYQVMIPSEGPKPGPDSVVTLHYVGTLTDGTIFDSSFSRGEPATFALSNTIEGFKEGVQLMSVGSRYLFTIPPELAYGERGAGDLIGPGDTLIFEVELLEINSN